MIAGITIGELLRVGLIGGLWLGLVGLVAYAAARLAQQRGH